MPEIPSDLGVLAKEIRSYVVATASDLRHLADMMRALHMDVSELTDIAEFEVRAALAHFDGGHTRRAQAVSRPLRHAQALDIVAARRCMRVWPTYLKQFEDMRKRTRGGRPAFNPEK